MALHLSKCPGVSLTEYLVNGVGQPVFLRGQGPMGQNDHPSEISFFEREKKGKNNVFCLNGLDGWCPLAGRCSEAAWWSVVVVVHVTAPPPSPPGDRRPPQSQCVNVPSYMFIVHEYIIKVIFFRRILPA